MLKTPKYEFCKYDKNHDTNNSMIDVNVNLLHTA